MEFKNIVAFFVMLILVACESITAQVPTETIILTNHSPLPSVTVTSKPTFAKTPTPTVTLTASQTFTPTLPVLLTADPALIKDFVGKYRMNAPGGVLCKLEIKRDATFAIQFIFIPTGMGETVNGRVFFADGRFYLSSPMRDTSGMPSWCFPQALIPVYWGPRRYLFFDNNEEFMAYIISDFCDNMKNGKEPQYEIRDISYYLRETDVRIKVTGLPIRQDGQLLCP